MVEHDQQVTAANHHCCPAVCTIAQEHRALIAAGVELIIDQHTVSFNGTGSNPMLLVSKQADKIYCLSWSNTLTI